MLEKALLERYKIKNPVKFAQKWPNKTIDEILSDQLPEAPIPVEKIKVEIKAKEEVEVGFKTQEGVSMSNTGFPEVGATDSTPVPGVVEAKKRGRKPKVK
jgi:hypothetical protein